MCGIAGKVRWAGLRPDEAEAGARMAETLRHRGPDEAGLHEDRWASLGHARLSIIDIEGGHQPLANEDGSVWVVFNGEIYNHRELRSQLQARGHQLHTSSDTEVIVHLYEDYGPAFVHRLNGMFAIALWDTRQHLLLLVRDRLGVKPLYWHDDGRRIVFGSELKALLAAPELHPRIDDCAVADYLTFGHVPAPRTIYQDVRKLEPGHMALCRASGVAVRQYWEIPAAESSRAIRSQGASRDLIESFAGTLEDAVRIRMVADVPLGAFLSGGLDSAAVVAAMSRAGSSMPISTHTVGFIDDRFDERAAAQETARLLGSDHHEILLHVDAVSAASHLAWNFDEPFADSSAIPVYYLSQATRRRVTVALAGDGADELLGGYRRYGFDLAEDAWRSGLPRIARQAAGLVGSLYPKADWLPRPLRAKVTLQNLACDAVSAHLRSTSLRCGLLPDLLLRSEVRSRLTHYDPFERPHALATSYQSDNLLGRLLYLDARTLLADDMLTKVDRASMAVGLEVREPFLDYRLVEQIVRMPPQLRSGKEAIRGSLRQWSLPTLADRPKKGFDIPVNEWFRGPLRKLAHDLLTDRNARISAWVEPRAIRSLCARHQQGWRNDGSVLWTLLAFELWARQAQSCQPAGTFTRPRENRTPSRQELAA